MLGVEYTARFRRDARKLRRQGADIGRLDEAITMLRRQERLPERMRDHELSGTYGDHRECHVAPDWLLVYRIDRERLVLTAVRTGPHSELFRL